jgi:hypothetical protein
VIYFSPRRGNWCGGGVKCGKKKKKTFAPNFQHGNRKRAKRCSSVTNATDPPSISIANQLDEAIALTKAVTKPVFKKFKFDWKSVTPNVTMTFSASTSKDKGKEANNKEALFFANLQAVQNEARSDLESDTSEVEEWENADHLLLKDTPTKVNHQTFKS